ncbi:hypothetical protein D9757_008583 [Collybiopsis confluens]|uniref:xylan 1,4-beta-xylosidase n=1 Tax=Collybiopsis confluens TaxID=2823264 RepID=A0A8H5HMY0_9AGAR|nr:hypothetical protein D9757_008583 [Collybiopsis confluens]
MSGTSSKSPISTSEMTIQEKIIWFVLSLTVTGAIAAFPDCTNGPLANNTVCDTSANFVDRAKALVAEFTVADMIANTGYQTPGVPRLGLPPYIWWNEALHGYAGSPGSSFTAAGSGLNYSFATSFPAPILLSAAFDDQLIHDIGTVIGTEARVFSNGGHAGLSFFTPNINPFRDPRWGRGQETPGEDPLHIGRYTYAMVTALQGGLGSELDGAHGKYLKIVADCKHYAAYDLENWEGINRSTFNAIVSLQDFAEFYSPSFQTCVRDAKAASIMCSFNAVNGVPSCASEYLMQNITRDFFGLGNDQWITADCDAVATILNHQYTNSSVNASAIALHAGTDIDCGTTYLDSFQAALDQGLIKESDIVQAMVRRYGSLVRLGYFDSPEIQPYRQLDFSAVNTPSAQHLAYISAVEGITLLKNDGTLPLKSTNLTVALIGPWANATSQMQSNYNGAAPFLISPLEGFKNAGFKVKFANGTANVSDTSTSGFSAALEAARSAEVIVFVGGVDDSIENEALDRTSIAWPGSQLELIGRLAEVGKPLIVLQMGGGQVDNTQLKANASINGLLWAGYPSQSGGTAIVDILTGKQAPAGRLPVTQYAADYVNQVQMTDMTLRPSSTSPGRTYKWYTGEAVYPFGFGLHYTHFSLEWARPPRSSYDIQELIAAAKSSGVAHIDLALLDNSAFELRVTNTGSVASDYTALLFSHTTAGPTPAPIKSLIGYTRVKDLGARASETAELNVTLGSIARADENGNSVLYPGPYSVWVDVDGTGQGEMALTSFELTGRQETIILRGTKKYLRRAEFSTRHLTPPYFVDCFKRSRLNVNLLQQPNKMAPSSSSSFFPLPQSETDDPHHPLGLTTEEKQWADLYPYLERRGYQLRARYRPGWVGSWLKEGLTTAEMMMRPTWSYEFDDAEPSSGALTVIDAVRTNDGTPVALKLISMSPSIITPDSNEIEILQYLSSPSLARDPRNHCIQMIDGFQVFTPAEMKGLGAAGYSNAFIAVFPFARRWKELPFRLAWEALDCVRQLLEGLAFLHEHNIAHRDIRPENLMLDASSQCFSLTNPLDRIDTGVRYIFIDLGSSTKFTEPRLVQFRDGWFKEIPEIYDIDDQGNRERTRFYEPFKADVYVLGVVLDNYFGKQVHPKSPTPLFPNERSHTFNPSFIRPSSEPFPPIHKDHLAYAASQARVGYFYWGLSEFGFVHEGDCVGDYFYLELDGLDEVGCKGFVEGAGVDVDVGVLRS